MLPLPSPPKTTHSLTIWFSIVALLLSIAAFAATCIIAWNNGNQAVDSESGPSPIVTMQNELQALRHGIDELEKKLNDSDGRSELQKASITNLDAKQKEIEERISELHLKVEDIYIEMQKIRPANNARSQSESSSSEETKNPATKSTVEQKPVPVPPSSPPNDSKKPPNE